MSTWLLKPAELSLKGENRRSFEKILKNNLARMLSNAGCRAKITMARGRFYVISESAQIVEDSLACLTGISGWAKAAVCEKSPDTILRACVHEGKKLLTRGAKTFKIDARRTDKSFPLDSYELCCKGGDIVCAECAPLKVDIHHPDDVIHIEIREKAYIYSGAQKGLGGLPAGSAGRGLLLLSGGIDSPAAGFLMAARGMSLDAIHFHAYPYTSQEAQDKVIRLAKLINSYTLDLRLYNVNFTAVQMKIKERAPQSWTTILLRMAMMEAAQKKAEKNKCKCLITGESLSQVASQTIENLSCTENRVTLPLLRPLIGMNKEAIIRISEKIGAFRISIEPYHDCCTLFTPPHPVLHGKPQEANKYYEALELSPLIEEALIDGALESIPKADNSRYYPCRNVP
jgi:thiamine biosynthesis protein ThiI